MGKIFLQMVVLAVLALAAAAVANFSARGVPERYLDWWPEGRYPNALEVQGCAEPPDGGPAGGSMPESAKTESPSGVLPGNDVVVDVPPGTRVEPVQSSHDERFPPVYYPGVIEELRGGASFIDARRSEEYRKGHISGAHSVPAWESPGEKVNALLELSEIVPAAPAVVYCSSSKDCEDSLIVSQLLEQAGFEEVKIYKGGFPEWEHKLPNLVVKGEGPGEVDYDLLPEGSADEESPPEEGATDGGSH